MKNQRCKKLHKKEIIEVTPSLLSDTTLLELTAAMYENPKFVCNKSIYWNTISDSNNLITLPENLTIWGDLNLNTMKISKLPKNLAVRGSLFLNGTNISQLEYLSANTIICNCKVTIDIKTVRFHKYVVYNKYNILNFKQFNQTIKNKFVFL